MKGRLACASYVLVGLIALSALGACNGGRILTHPITVCGQVLDPNNRPGFPVYDLPGAATGTAYNPVTPGVFPLYLRLTAGCDSGADITISPPGAIAITASAHAKDGLLVAVALSPRVIRPGPVTLTASNEGHIISTVELGGPSPTLSTAAG